MSKVISYYNGIDVRDMGEPIGTIKTPRKYRAVSYYDELTESRILIVEQRNFDSFGEEAWVPAPPEALTKVLMNMVINGDLNGTMVDVDRIKVPLRPIGDLGEIKRSNGDVR